MAISIRGKYENPSKSPRNFENYDNDLERLEGDAHVAHLWDEYVGISLFNIIFLIMLMDVCYFWYKHRKSEKNKRNGK